MILLDDATVLNLTEVSQLIPAIRQAFLEPAETPARMHGDLPGADDAKLLIMPSWAGRSAIGVKVITSIPSNVSLGKATVDGIYVLIDGQTGQALAVLSARSLTALRTASVCALATSVLSREDSRVLLMIGTGALAPHLVSAYLQVRRLERVMLWGRDWVKARNLAARLATLPVQVGIAENLSDAISSADIISSATSACVPLIGGAAVGAGTHVDLIGSFTPQMREADSELFKRGHLVVDSLTALEESGDVVVPLREGALKLPIPDLTELLKDPSRGRIRQDQITIFKSVGTGLADLAAARYVLSRYRESA